MQQRGKTNVRRLAKGIKPTVGVDPLLDIMQGTIVSTTGSKSIVTLADGSDVPDVYRLASYTPSNGDVVWMLRFHGDLLILGKQG
jgi:hypothetical protein